MIPSLESNNFNIEAGVAMSLLEVNNLHASFNTDDGIVKAVRGVTFRVGKAESLGIVGESGCGKSVTMLSIMRLLPGSAKLNADAVLFDNQDLLRKTRKQMREIQGRDIGMIFQDPMTSLNPLYTIGNQIMEPLKIHQKLTGAKARAKAVEMLELVGIPSPESRLKQYPHEFSGGMRQRVMIAIALSCNPKLLIADEPTTALDVTIQAQILELMLSLKEKLGTAIILISHDLGVIVNMCSRVQVMYGGLIVEEAATDELFYNSMHPYTWGLINSLPKPANKEKTKLIPIPGSPPDLLRPPSGCPFTPRCPHAMKVCKEYMPASVAVSGTHKVSCWLLDSRASGKTRR